MSLIPWIQVNGSPILKEIREEWTELLDNGAENEPAYQRFLSDHAGFFFPRNWNGEDLIVSELRLGADHKVDFVSILSERSYGFVYRLIEIESPHASAFTKAGDPSARLSHALQQIRDWKAFLAGNVIEAKRLFPSKRHHVQGDAHFQYMVVIGRRGDVPEHTERRNQFADELNVSIRSFDWFTDNLDHRLFGSFTDFSNDFRPVPLEVDNAFTNPFYAAYTDVEWRKFVGDRSLDIVHMIGHNIDALRRLRRYNTPRLEAFLTYLRTLPPERQVPFELEYPHR